MRRMVAIITLLLGTVVFSPVSAFAAGPVDNAISALKSGSVYIEPGTEFTGRDTVVTLTSTLRPNDHIVLVMLPESALEGTTIDAIAERIDNGTGSKHIIGLSVGKETLGYTKLLPAGVTSDSMDRATSISNNPVDALRTFPKVIHEWQAAHPEVEYPELNTNTSTQVPQAPPESSMVPYGVGGGVFIAIAVILAVVFKMRKTDNPYKIKSSPAVVRDQLNRIIAFVPQIDDNHVVEKLNSVITDTEAFFRQSQRSSTRDTEKEAAEFARKLTEAVKMLDTYVWIQDNPRYAEDPHKLLASGALAVDGLAVSVLNTVRSSNTKALLNYKTSSDILDAERYRS